MTTIIGRNCKVEVALTFAASAPASAITKAYPPVVSDTAHGLADGAVGYFSIAGGMIELDQQAFMVNNKATDTFEIPGLDATSFSTFTTGDYYIAATWGTISEAAGYSIGGGAADQLDDTRLVDTKRRNVAGLLPAQDVTIDVKNQLVSGTAMQFIERKAQTGGYVLMKITQAGTVVRVFYGSPSLPGESASSGQLASGQFSVTVPQFALKPNV
mgnify:CR=1 FL=1